MHKSLRLTLANNVPYLGQVRRLVRSYVDAKQSSRQTYSQHGEDVYVLDKLAKYDLSASIYVDVGANHPTSISNSFLLYRNGLHGVVVEPNPELVQLHKRFRPRDVAIGVGCGQTAGIGKFQILSTPVLSHFESESPVDEMGVDVRICRTDYLPILPLDTILAAIEYEWICFLSIDTEGFDYEVLCGATNTLRKSLYLCVEANSAASDDKIIELLDTVGFSVDARLGCNIIAQNTSPSFKRYKRA